MPSSGLAVHLARADLDLERAALRPDHGRVQGAVAVELRHRDVVLEAAGHRLPERVDEAERAVAVARPLVGAALADDAHGRQVVDLVELAALLGHLVVDGIEVLRAARDLGRDVDLVELAQQLRGGLVDVLLAVGAPLGDHRLDLRVLPRVERLERDVLELPLQLVDAEPMCERPVDVERLARLLHLRLAAPVLERAHVVEPVGQLDEDDPHVAGHREDHLAVVLRLRVLAALEADAGQLRDALDELGDLVAELVAHLLDRDLGVLDDVVHERGRDRLVVEPQLGADLGGAERVVDEVLARAALLALVRLGGEGERAGQQLPVDFRVVGRDLGEQLLDEVLVSLWSLENRHTQIVLRAPEATVPV